MQLTVTFDVDTDPNIDQVNVQNRMAQAQPNLPPEVNQFGLTMRKSTGLPMLIVALLLAEARRYDALFLANYANINIVDALYRVPGVGEVAHLRRRRLRDAHLGEAGSCSPSSASRCPDLASAIQQQSTVNPAGQVGGQPGAVRPGDDLHGPRAGPPADRRGVRRHRRALEPGRLGRAPARRRAHRARRARTTSRSAASTASRAARSPCSRRPARTRWRSPKGVKRRDGRAAARASPPTSTTRYTLDTTPPVSEGIREILITLAEAMVLVVARRLSCSSRTGAPR